MVFPLISYVEMAFDGSRHMFSPCLAVRPGRGKRHAHKTGQRGPNRAFEWLFVLEMLDFLSEFNDFQ